MQIQLKGLSAALVSLAFIAGCTVTKPKGIPSSDNESIVSCDEAVKLYEANRWRTLWDIQEILCRSRDESRFPSVTSSKCLMMASENARAARNGKILKFSSDELETTCYGRTTEDAVKERCLKGEFNYSGWETASCKALTGMSFIEFEEWYDKNN